MTKILSILAKETFVAMGKKLIARRKHDELDVMQSYIPLDNQIEDPADQDPELRKLLEESAKSAESKMNKVRILEMSIFINIKIRSMTTKTSNV